MSEAVKQVILIRKDLKMKPGKLAAQAAHASSKIFLDELRESPRYPGETPSRSYRAVLNSDMVTWKDGIYRKVCLAVNSEEELKCLIEKAKKEFVPTSLIEDIGLTCFDEPTITCGAIGPASDELIDAIVGHLKLY